MKKILFICIAALFFVSNTNANQVKTNDETDKMAILCKIWGFAKYHHPEVANGDFDMDSELIKLIPLIINSSNVEERNAILIDWLQSLGEITDIMEKEDYPDSVKIKFLPDYSWITEDYLGSELVDELEKIRMAKRSYTKHHYFEFEITNNVIIKNEATYNYMNYKDLNYRLLGLFRYWNIVQYFFPYRNLIDNDWHAVLNESIPLFAESNSEYDYKYNMLALIAKISDTHANIWNSHSVLNPIFRTGYYYTTAPVDVKFIEGKAVVVGYKDPDLGEESGLLPGDIIETIDDVIVDKIVEDLLPVTPASNYTTQLRDIAAKLLKTKNGTIKVTYKRNNETHETNLKCYSSFSNKTEIPSFRTIGDSITIIYPGSIVESDLYANMPDALNSKGIIIDLRCYPNDFVLYSLGEYLMPKSTQFAKSSCTNFKYPGLFAYKSTISVGRSNSNYYKGKVVILINEETYSSSEFHAMAFRVAPNAVVVGSTTAGADGNTSLFYLPGNILSTFSGIGIYYPDGTETQRIGIVPDIEVLPTIEGIKNGKDEQMEKAINIINGVLSSPIVSTDEKFHINFDTNSDLINFQLIEGNGEIKIYDIYGRVQLKDNVYQGCNYVNTQSLASGMYICVYTSLQGKCYAKKFMKL